MFEVRDGQQLGQPPGQPYGQQPGQRYDQPGQSGQPPDPRLAATRTADPDAAWLQGMDAEKPGEASADEMARHRHATLMGLLEYESERQAEERLQMQVDEDYQDHLQWRPEDAAELMERGQAPLVFNEGRQTIDWLAGTEKRMRKDYKILPREPDDEQAAELKTKLVKYTDDVNLTQWHRSKAFKQAAAAGLSWLEEGVNPDPEAEIIYSGMEDWRNVYRDSHSRNLDYNVDARYQHRRRVIDLDYACALLPGSRAHLCAMAGRHDDVERGDDIWYMGERLTGASETQWSSAASIFGSRTAYMARNGYVDNSRRRSVELIESWYRVPDTVEVFQGGLLHGRVYNPADPLHVEVRRGHPAGAIYRTVKFRMRLMIGTREAPCLDVASPFRHQKFILIPIWGYRRARDGMAYGAWRGMRDIQDDLNKRRSKALFALSVNRVVMEDGAVDDVEDLRTEAAKPDGIIVKKRGKDLQFVANVADFQANLELAQQDSQSLRNAGGVTNENLGRDTSAQSGKAIMAKQDQGSLTSSELFDNLLLAILNAGRIRLSNIEQFYTEAKAIRIVGGRQPIEWLRINQEDPLNPGRMLNDVTATQADFIVDTQDYRTSLAQAALEQMFALLGQIATFAPQVVLNVLDLVVETADIKDKEEWVARIRKLNGQRDPGKPPTPEEQQAEQQAAQQGQARAAEQEQIATDTAKAALGELQAKIELLRAQVGRLDTEGVLKKVETMYSALQAAQIVARVPGVTPAADEIAASAGLVDQHPGDIPPPLAAGGAGGVAGAADAAGPAAGPVGPGGVPQMAGPQAGMQQGIDTPTGADNVPPDAAPQS